MKKLSVDSLIRLSAVVVAAVIGAILAAVFLIDDDPVLPEPVVESDGASIFDATQESIVTFADAVVVVDVVADRAQGARDVAAGTSRFAARVVTLRVVDTVFVAPGGTKVPDKLEIRSGGYAWVEGVRHRERHRGSIELLPGNRYVVPLVFSVNRGRWVVHSTESIAKVVDGEIKANRTYGTEDLGRLAERLSLAAPRSDVDMSIADPFDRNALAGRGRTNERPPAPLFPDKTLGEATVEGGD